MSIYYTEDIQMFYDDNVPLFKPQPKKYELSSNKNIDSQEQQGKQINEYQVVWIDNLQNKYLVTLKIGSDILVKEFLYIVIGEFNQVFKKVEVDNFFFINDCNIYELYEMDEDERPDEELPSYDENQRLNNIKTTNFALKQTILFIPNLLVSSIDDPQSVKSPISPRSEEDKINPQNNVIQNTERTEPQEELEIPQPLDKQIAIKPWWYFCCGDE